MEKDNTYKYLSIVLAIVAIVFAILYFTKQSEPITETLGDISTDVRSCRDEIAAWQQAHMNGVPVTAEDQTALNIILDNCKTAIENTQTKL